MELSTETIEQLTRRAFPQATVVSSRLLAGGRNALNYALQLQNPTVQAVLRLYPPDTPPAALDKEMYALRVIMPETGVPTPRVIHLDASRTLLERPFALLNLLPGEPLAAALPRMTASDREAVGYEAGRYLAKLHSVPLDKFGEFLGQDAQASNDEKAYTVARAAEWLEVCEQNALLDGATLADLRRLVGQSQALKRAKPCFVHGDYGPGHINVQEGWGGFHVTGVFGFTQAQGWSPEWDVARLLHETSADYPGLIKGFLDGYADTASLPPDLWQRLPVYRVVVGAVLVSQAHRAGEQASLEVHRARLHRFLQEETQLRL